MTGPTRCVPARAPGSFRTCLHVRGVAVSSSTSRSRLPVSRAWGPQRMQAERDAVILDAST